MSLNPWPNRRLSERRRAVWVSDRMTQYGLGRGLSIGILMVRPV